MLVRVPLTSKLEVGDWEAASSSCSTMAATCVWHPLGSDRHSIVQQ